MNRLIFIYLHRKQNLMNNNKQKLCIFNVKNVLRLFSKYKRYFNIKSESQSIKSLNVKHIFIDTNSKNTFKKMKK